MKQYPHAGRVGCRLQAVRDRQGVSLREMARRAGLTHSTLGRIERGEVNFPYETLVRITQALGVALCDIVCGGS